MKLRLKSRLFTLTLTILVGCVSSAGLAAETSGESAVLVVVLGNGQSYSGTLGPESDAAHLDLIVQRPGITLTRTLPWEAVARVSDQGQVVSAADYRQKIAQLRQQMPIVKPRPVTTLTLIGHDPQPAAIAPARAKIEPSPVRHLNIDVSLGGWTEAVENDGLVVYVEPVDAAGRQIAVDGTLEVELIGMRQGVARPEQPFERIGQWSEPVRADDFGPRGAVVRLAFQAVDPQHDVNFAAKGVVHARLSVPGQGTFDATETDVRIRPYSALRDARQQSVLDGRYFQVEPTPGER